MFSRARIRLTAWYAGVLAAFLVLLGTAVYLVEKHQLVSNVNHGLHVQAARVEAAYVDRGYSSIIALSDAAPSAYRVSLMVTPSLALMSISLLGLNRPKVWPWLYP